MFLSVLIAMTFRLNQDFGRSLSEGYRSEPGSLWPETASCGVSDRSPDSEVGSLDERQSAVNQLLMAGHCAKVLFIWSSVAYNRCAAVNETLDYD